MSTKIFEYMQVDNENFSKEENNCKNSDSHDVDKLIENQSRQNIDAGSIEIVQAGVISETPIKVRNQISEDEKLNVS